MMRASRSPCLNRDPSVPRIFTQLQKPAKGGSCSTNRAKGRPLQQPVDATLHAPAIATAAQVLPPGPRSRRRAPLPSARPNFGAVPAILFQPRPIRGMAVAMMVMNWTLASGGNCAMCRTAAATWAMSIVGSARMLPSACGTPRV